MGRTIRIKILPKDAAMDRKMFETERNTAIPVDHAVELVWSNLLELLYSSCAIRGVSLLPKEVLAGYVLRLSKSRCTSYLTIQLINLDRLWGFNINIVI